MKRNTSCSVVVPHSLNFTFFSQVAKSDDFQLKREVSIYSIGDLLKETVANETLTDQRDRKYFIVTQKEKCCRPPPLFVTGISIVQVITI